MIKECSDFLLKEDMLCVCYVTCLISLLLNSFVCLSEKVQHSHKIFPSRLFLNKHVWRWSCRPLPSPSGTPGRSLSAEPVGLTWVGSLQPPRRTCLHLVSGVSPVRPCSPASLRARERTGGRARVSSACEVQPSFSLRLREKKNKNNSSNNAKLPSLDLKALSGCNYFWQSKHHTPPVTPGSKSIILVERSLGL